VSACQSNQAIHAENIAKDLKHSAASVLPLRLGAENIDSYLPSLQGKRVGLVVNQTSVLPSKQNNASQTQHLVDFLRDHKVNIVLLFAPEHGVRGNKGAGVHIDNGKDADTLIPIQSIYGKNKTPPNSVMKNLDTIIFDIQDVGVRFYTYISSMHYMMEAAAKHNIEFIVLDRPNPNGKFVDGPVLDMEYQSFVGMHPIPVLHGLTIGELALMIKGEKWIKNADDLRLKVVQMSNYRKSDSYKPPIAPSPNLPNYQAIRLYPSLCFFEATAVSVGRGTAFPFQVTGHDIVYLGDFEFMPISMPLTAPHPKLQNTKLYGVDLQKSDIQGLDLGLFIGHYQAFQEQGIPFYTSPGFMDKLAGTDKLRIAIEADASVEQIRQSWQADLTKYKETRASYLLYPL
jgi:uncharacterized protein YbbC (DUF1343 family)